MSARPTSPEDTLLASYRVPCWNDDVIGWEHALQNGSIMACTVSRCGVNVATWANQHFAARRRGPRPGRGDPAGLYNCLLLATDTCTHHL